MSTSLRYDYRPNHFKAEDSNKLILLIIRIPKGAYINHISNRDQESEFLLSREQSLKIAKVIYFKYKNTILLCDVMNYDKNIRIYFK